MTTPQFARKWAENTTLEAWDDTQYKAGWATIGDTPPTVQQFDAVLNELDSKAQYLYEWQSGFYNPSRQYRAGDIIFVPDDDNVSHVGNFYEAYHPDGCLGKDPRDATNRPDGWTNTDPAAPYYWIKHGKWLDLPTIGTPVGLFKTALPQGYLKLNGTTVNASKFWRLAQTYPDLVTSGNINLPDLRAEFMRGLDDGRGIDTGRMVGSWQKGSLYMYDNDGVPGSEGMGWYGVGDAGYDLHNAPTNQATYADVIFNASGGFVRGYAMNNYKGTAVTRPMNIALLYATRF